ncbi:MipA/OmpV family protein [Sagittula salina]|uniref:MipA/OmpV family protein n=1 Tax=Sagittula salina TaxID=2820268 RepID=A0A940MT11_9RHOB|nr:MipA/OmpV family protein [Sagittula salina]MBP0482429.1 MipA/OmpV family protein [Sagittula salina]
MSLTARFVVFSLTLGCAAPAVAQDRALAFELGFGVQSAPAYEGSDEYVAAPALSGSVSTFRMLGLNVDRGDGMGFGFGPSFRVLPERTAKDHPRLTGIANVDAAFELGARVSWRWEGVEAWTAVRKGVTGHDGVVADVGSDIVHDYGQGTEVRFGPRLSMANNEYASTYFSVPAGAALPAYSAGAGLYKVGLELGVRHDFNDAWAVKGTVGWDRLVGDVGDSPVVQSRDSGSVGVQVIRSFDFRF